MHQPRQEQEKRAKVVRQKRTTWTYEDENGRDLGQNHLEEAEDGREKNVSIRLLNNLHNNFLNFYIIAYRVLMNRLASVKREDLQIRYQKLLHQ